MTMITDGTKHAGVYGKVPVQDIAEYLAQRLGLI
jgi:hypothetical protein